MKKPEDFQFFSGDFGRLTFDSYLKLQVHEEPQKSLIMSPIMSPETATAIVDAEKLVLHARSQLAEIQANIQLLHSGSDVFQQLKSEYQPLPKKNLFKFHKATVKSGMSEHVPISRNRFMAINESNGVGIKVKPKITRKYEENERKIAPRILLTDRGVQVDEVEIRKVQNRACSGILQVQKAQLVNIVPSLTVQKCDPVHISPDATWSQSSQNKITKNVRNFEYRYNLENRENCGKTPAESKSKKQEESPNIPLEKEKALVLEGFSFSELDQILKANSEMLNRITKSTSEFCKVIHCSRETSKKVPSSFPRTTNLTHFENMETQKHVIPLETSSNSKDSTNSKENMIKPLETQNNILSNCENDAENSVEILKTSNEIKSANNSDSNNIVNNDRNVKKVEEIEKTAVDRFTQVAIAEKVMNNVSTIPDELLNENLVDKENSFREMRMENFCMDRISARLANHISSRIDEEMKIVRERAETFLEYEEKRNACLSSEIARTRSSAEPLSEGEIDARSSNSRSLGEIKSVLSDLFLRVPLKTSTSNEDNSSLNTSISSHV